VLRFLPPRNLLLAVSTVLALKSIGLGQTPSGAEPRFITRAELVTVPVIVTDKAGSHIHNLAKADFAILEDGKEQKIASLEEIQASAGPIQHLSAPQGQFSNRFAPESAPAQLIILVLDVVNTPPEDQAYAKNELLKYLANSADSGQSACLLAITRGGIKVIHDFSTDWKGLAAALQTFTMGRQLVEEASQEAIPKSHPEIAKALQREREKEQQMESIERHAAIVITLQAMQQISQYCAGLPGRKALLWATAGFPFSISEAQSVIKIVGPRSDSLTDVSDLYQKAWRTLVQAQISVYPVDVHGLANPTYADVSISNPEADFDSHNEWKVNETHDTLQQFAEATGGRAFYNRNDLKEAFGLAANDSRNYYLLSYYLDRRGKRPGWHQLNVRVHRDGVKVRARRGFLLALSDSKQTAESEVQIALSSPLDYTGIPINGQWQKVVPASEPGKMKVIFQLTMPANFAVIDEGDDNHFQVQFMAVARTATGAPANETSKTMDGHLKPDTVAQIRNSGMDYRGSLTLSPGEYTVHFAVQDDLSGRIGSVTAPLKVELLKAD
jgi:VWFA-related protein